MGFVVPPVVVYLSLTSVPPPEAPLLVQGPGLLVDVQQLPLLGLLAWLSSRSLALAVCSPAQPRSLVSCPPQNFYQAWLPV